MNASPIEYAISQWQQAIGEERVVTDANSLRDACADTSPLVRKIPCVLRPGSEKDVRQIVRIAADTGVALFPVSTGRNWGYGTANPTADDCAMVDLSGMRSILEFDEDLGWVTLEPGVTQQQLSDFFAERGVDFLVPVTGAGPDCSLIGNALERGYGITPIADHFSAVTRIRAVLPDGSIYDSPLSELGGASIDRSFKWGVGPYLDGLFTQSNLGIVTSMTIALARRPQKVVGFFFGLAADTRLEDAVLAVRRILQKTAGTTGSINLMNRHRVLSMVEPYPAHLADGELIPAELLASMARRNQVMIWTGAGALYGDGAMVAAAKRIVRRELRGIASRLVFFTPGNVSLLNRLAGGIPGGLGRQAQNIFGTLDKTLRLLAGSPSEIALPLCYWKSGTPPAAGRRYDPARDGCGLYWYSPLVPMTPALVRDYVTLVERICRDNRIEPLITLTSLSERCWDSTVPILFDPQDETDVGRAEACYRELFETGRQRGFVPYRSHVRTMEWFVNEQSGFWQTAAAIKDAIDPAGIIAPGRYSLR
ncbi:MAG: FAD-binding oxidoreductase [Gammaproteobacteria bacterium]|nr:FAD-binding oxidoreductase [Gammaproteobacteria bacterium]